MLESAQSPKLRLEKPNSREVRIWSIGLCLAAIVAQETAASRRAEVWKFETADSPIWAQVV
jgi:hypothetical protein